MKKSLLLVGGAILASVVMTGCAGVGTNNGAVTLSGAGMNLYSEMSANAMLSAVNVLYNREEFAQKLNEWFPEAEEDGHGFQERTEGH